MILSLIVNGFQIPRLRQRIESLARDNLALGTLLTGDELRMKELIILSAQAVANLQAARQAIRTHRDQRGDDRCWMDDEVLYASLPEGYTPPERDSAVMLEHCRRFITCRQNPATTYVSPEREIERLQNLVASTITPKPGSHVEPPQPWPKPPEKPVFPPNQLHSEGAVKMETKPAE